MFKLVVNEQDFFDDATQEFMTIGDVEIVLEHSLVSLSKWESFYEKPFLTTENKTTEEIIFYVQCMTLTPDIAPEVFQKLSDKNLEQINNYISAKMSATWFSEIQPSPKATEIITSELVYYWMVTFNIPFECENWHLNRLFTLIRVCNLKSAKPKKMTRAEVAARNRELNNQRRQQLGSKG